MYLPLLILNRMRVFTTKSRNIIESTLSASIFRVDWTFFRSPRDGKLESSMPAFRSPLLMESLVWLLCLFGDDLLRSEEEEMPLDDPPPEEELESELELSLLEETLWSLIFVSILAFEELIWPKFFYKYIKIYQYNLLNIHLLDSSSI